MKDKNRQLTRLELALGIVKTRDTDVLSSVSSGSGSTLAPRQIKRRQVCMAGARDGMNMGIQAHLIAVLLPRRVTLRKHRRREAAQQEQSRRGIPT